MSTKKESTSSSSNQIQYDPAALQQYQKGIGTSMPILQQYAKSPYANPFFQTNLGMLNQQALQAGGRNVQNLFNNMRQGGFAGQSMSPFLQSQLAAQGRGTSRLQQSGRFSAMQQALQNQLFSLGSLQGFQPLLTGSSSQGQATEKTSGLGTWLPQLAGAAIQGAMAFGTGGASLAAGGAAKGLSGAMKGGSWSAPTSWLPNVTGGYFAPNVSGPR